MSVLPGRARRTLLALAALAGLMLTPDSRAPPRPEPERRIPSRIELGVRQLVEETEVRRRRLRPVRGTTRPVTTATGTTATGTTRTATTKTVTTATGTTTTVATGTDTTTRASTSRDATGPGTTPTATRAIPTGAASTRTRTRTTTADPVVSRAASACGERRPSPPRPPWWSDRATGSGRVRVRVPRCRRRAPSAGSSRRPSPGGIR